MKNITLTPNEALVLIAEGMTMNNVKSLANKLRNADAPVAASDSNLQIAQAEAGTWEAAYNAAMVDLEVAKQNLKLANQQVYDYERDLESYARQDDESLKYFRKWVEQLRVATDADKGLAPAGVFSQAVQMIKESNRLGDRVVDLESKLNKANDVIAAVKLVYDADDFNDDKISLITSVVEAYYRGN